MFRKGVWTGRIKVKEARLLYRRCLMGNGRIDIVEYEIVQKGGAAW